MSSLSKEQFKARIIEEFNRENSALKYLIRGSTPTGEYFLRRVTCSEFEIDIDITPIDGYQYSIQFVEYEPSEYKLDTALVDLSDEEYISRSFHAIETIDFWSGIIRFGVLRKKITHVDYKFVLTDPSWIAYRKHAKFDTARTLHPNESVGEMSELISFCEKQKKTALMYHEYHFSEKDRKLLYGFDLPKKMKTLQKKRFYNIFESASSGYILMSSPSNMVKIMSELIEWHEKN